ncbi:MAG TPA: cell wall-binding repeat-containing protein, partial [Nocardioidaceae bacterium]|nr:cell wall-binding repeat-containing protein [Nocardioidaceae bacterium]
SSAGSSDAALATSGDLVVGSSTVGGNLLLKALGSLTVGSAATVSAGGSAVLVSDAGNPSPPAVGTSMLTVASNATLTSGGSLSLYAARQDQVSVGQGATLNGATYSPGTAYVDTASEQWGVYYPGGAPQRPYTFFYKDQGTQTITFTSSPPGQVTVGDNYTPTATSSSGLPVTLTIDPSSSGVCSIGATGVVTFDSTGTCVVDANQAGNTDYAPAAQVQQSITVVPHPAPPGPSFPGPVTGWDEATSSSPTGTATATQGCVTATATGVGTVVAANYASNPVGDPAFRPAGVWFDVQTTGSSAFSRLDVSCRVPSSAAGGNTLYWWDGSSWQMVSGQSFDPGTSTVTATVSETSSPALGDLTGTVFAVAVRPLVSRMAGADREHTAIEISQAVFGPAEAGAVVLARQDAYPDALVGGPLAVARHAPLLLTSRTGLDPAVAVEIQRVLAPGGTVFLLGGRASLAPTVEQALADLGYRVHRLGGATRYDTAAIVANRLPHAHRVLLATGSDFPDALTASTAAAHTGGVVLLTHGASMPARTMGWLSRHPSLPVTAIGGPAATADPAAQAFVGKDRYATAALVASSLFVDPTAVGIASGLAFPDALTAVTQLGGLDAPLLLTRDSQLPATTSSWLTAHRATLTGIDLYGGTTAVGADVESTVTALAGGIDR